MPSKMIVRAFLFTASLLFICQVVAGQGLNECEWFATIGRKDYCIYDKMELSRIGGSSICTTANMTLATFEENSSYEQAWRWLVDNGRYYDSWWIGGLRDEDSSTWYWEDSGSVIDYFYWEPTQPDLANDTSSPVCMYFRAGFYSGWHDVHCNNDVSYTMCQTPKD